MEGEEGLEPTSLTLINEWSIVVYPGHTEVVHGKRDMQVQSVDNTSHDADPPAGIVDAGCFLKWLQKPAPLT